MKYVRRKLQEVDVVNRVEDTEERTGLVIFINEFGSRCVMTPKQFDGLYQPAEDQE